jgi:hypothetical protein
MSKAKWMNFSGGIPTIRGPTSFGSTSSASNSIDWSASCTVRPAATEPVGSAERSPDEAVAMLKSLVDLYGPNGANEEDAEISDVVQLASRQLEALQAQIAEQRERQLASLQERLDTAERLTETDPQQAAAMYRAMIELHSDDEWAETVVGQARRRLAELEATDK